MVDFFKKTIYNNTVKVYTSIIITKKEVKKHD